MGELEGERFCIAPHLPPHFKLGRALQFWEKVTCVAPSPFGEEHWKTKSSKRLFVLDYCFTLRCRSFHLLTQINIHFTPRYFGISFATLTSAYAKSASSSLKFDYQPNSARYNLVLLGKCLGFAPRSKSFAIEPSVQVCSISSLSEFRFAEMSCFATPASASSIRTQIRYAQLTFYS